MPKRQANLPQPSYGFQRVFVSFRLFLVFLRTRRQIIVGIETARSESTPSGRGGVCGDEIITSDDAFEGNPTVCFCSGGVRAQKGHILKRHSSPGGWSEGTGWRKGGTLTSGQRGSVSWVFSTWQNSAALFHPAAFGCRIRPTHSGSRSNGSSLFHYTHNLQLRHVWLVSLSSFAAPPETVLMLLCI